VRGCVYTLHHDYPGLEEMLTGISGDKEVKTFEDNLAEADWKELSGGG